MPAEPAGARPTMTLCRRVTCQCCNGRGEQRLKSKYTNELRIGIVYVTCPQCLGAGFDPYGHVTPTRVPIRRRHAAMGMRAVYGPPQRDAEHEVLT